MNKKGFTLIELLIVIAIIGIVAAIAIPNLLTALQKGKQKATMGDMKSNGTAIESYITDNYQAPLQAAGNISQLKVYLIPFHTKLVPEKDGWGTPLRYDSNEERYSIISYGRDKADSSPDITQSPYQVTSLPGFDNDIIFSNGNFTYGPKVK